MNPSSDRKAGRRPGRAVLPRAGRVLPLVLALGLCFAGIGWGEGARAAGLAWQPGFPMRAGQQVLLMWMPVPGAAGYAVDLRDLTTGQKQSWEVPGTQFVDADVRLDHTYVYGVRALLSGGRMGPGSGPGRVEGVRPLEAPRWGGHFVGAGGVNLVWTAIEGAAFYNLYRAIDGQQPALLASLQAVKYVDADLTPGVSYTYTVRAVGARSQESPLSEPLEVAIGAGDGGGASAPATALARVGLQSLAAFRKNPDYRLGEPTDLSWIGGGVCLSDMGSRKLIVLAGDGTLLSSFGSKPAEYEGAWGIPWGLGVDPGGKRLAATFLQSSHVRVFTSTGVLVLDVAMQRPEGFEDWPVAPQPMDVAVGPDGDLWVTDYTFGQVVHLDARGRELGRVGTPKQADDGGPFKSPTFLDLDPDSGELFVVDSLLARIFVLGPDGTILRSWDRPKEPEGALNLPKGIAVMPSGDVLVVDGIRSTLQAFAPDGTLRAVYHSKDVDYLDLRGLVSVTVDPATDDLYLLSKIDSTVYRLHPTTP